VAKASNIVHNNYLPDWFAIYILHLISVFCMYLMCTGIALFSICIFCSQWSISRVIILHVPWSFLFAYDLYINCTAVIPKIFSETDAFSVRDKMTLNGNTISLYRDALSRKYLLVRYYRLRCSSGWTAFVQDQPYAYRLVSTVVRSSLTVDRLSDPPAFQANRRDRTWTSISG